MKSCNIITKRYRTSADFLALFLDFLFDTQNHHPKMDDHDHKHNHNGHSCEQHQTHDHSHSHSTSQAPEDHGHAHEVHEGIGGHRRKQKQATNCA